MARSERTANARPRCTGRTTAGAPCRSWALLDGSLCHVHDPRRAQTMQAARSKGARNSNKLRALTSKRSRLSTPAELVTFTARVVHEVLDGQVEQDVARVALYGVSILRQLVEDSELERRLEALEAKSPVLHAPGGRQWSA